jgi:hypothetical protein
MEQQLAREIVDEEEVAEGLREVEGERSRRPGLRPRLKAALSLPSLSSLPESRKRLRADHPFVVMEIVQDRTSPMVNVYAFRPGSKDLQLLDSPGPGQVRIFPWTAPVDVSVDTSRQSAFQEMLRDLYTHCNHRSWTNLVFDGYKNSIYHSPTICPDCHLYVVYDPRSAPYMGMPVPSAALQIDQVRSPSSTKFDSIKYEVSYVCKPWSSEPDSEADADAAAMRDFSGRVRVYQVLRAIMRRLLHAKPGIRAFVLDSISRQATDSYKKAGFEIDDEHDEHAEMPTMTATRERILGLDGN